MSLWTPLGVLGERTGSIVDPLVAVNLLSPGGCFIIKARCWLLMLVRWPQLFLMGLFSKISRGIPTRAEEIKGGALMIELGGAGILAFRRALGTALGRPQLSRPLSTRDAPVRIHCRPYDPPLNSVRPCWKPEGLLASSKGTGSGADVTT